MAVRRLSVEIVGSAKGAQKAFGDLEKSADKSGKKTTRSLSGIQTGLVGLGVGAAALGSFKAFEESEKISRQTAAVIKSTGGTAQVTADHIGDLAGEMSKLGGVDDELVQQGANMLLTFTKVRNEVGKGNDIFDQATAAANDYAAATGTDVVDANKMLGKALNDPIKGLTALTRAGVSFTHGQKDQIKAMVASGDTMGAQKIILAEFSKEYGGSLEANATASGKAQVAMENLGESAGAILAPGLELLAGAASSGAEALSSLPVPAQQAVVGIAGVTAAAAYAGPKVVEMAGNLKDGATAAKNWGQRMNEAGNLGKFGKGLAVAAAGVGAFTVTLTALESAASSKIDVDGLTKDLEDLASGVIKPDEALQEFGGSVDDLAEKFRLSSEDSLGNRLKNWGGDLIDTKQANNEIKDLDQTLASMVTSGNAESAREAYRQLSVAMIEQGRTAEEVASLLPKYWTEIERTERASSVASVVGGVLAGSIGLVGDEAAGASEGVGDFASMTEKVRDAASGATDKIKGQTGALADLNEEMQTHIDLASDAVGAALSEREAHDRVQDSQVALAEARKTGDAEQIQRAQDDLTQSILGEAAAADEAARKAAELSGKQYGAAESATVQKNRLTELQEQTGFTSNEIKWMSAQLDNAARERQISVDTSQAITNIRRLIDEIRNLSEVGSVVSAASGMIDAGVSGALAKLGPMPPPPGRAKGGSVHRGSIYEVNEDGTELFAPGMTGSIIPAAQSRALVGGMAAGGAPTYITVQVQGNVISNDDLLDAVETGLNKRGRRDGRTGLNIIRGAITV